ncbi:hypothetical protein MRBLMI12_000474 [Microbacterium sp. LMI12-1-1.1]|uniref:SNF2-related protein n=1 Tax=Microbacterium sp. LMI12-1-1.1 TaxID=3135225 RepID=UPI0034292941
MTPADLCAECGESLWAPNPKAEPEHAHILLRWVHDHSAKKVVKAVKFLPVDWSMDDEQSKIHGRITPSQERAIELAVAQIGTSNGIVIGDEPGFGKTAIGAELIKRAGWTRALIIGLPNTHDQWHERVFAQSDGEIRVRIMNGTTVAGRANFEAFMKGEDGIFVAGSHFLTEKDWVSEPQFSYDLQPDGSVEKWPLFKVVKKTGLMEFKPRKDGAIGPAEEPVRVRKSRRIEAYRRTSRKPLQGIVFDEVQAIANRKSATRRTMGSIKATYYCAMSGTWFRNKLENMWSVARWTWPGTDPETGQPYVETNHARWKARFLDTENIVGQRGKVLTDSRGEALTNVLGERIEGEFVGTLPAYIRREGEPVPAPEVIWVDPTPEQRAQIQDLEEDLMTWVMGWDGEEAPLVVDMPMVLQTRLRQVVIAEISYGQDGDVAFHDDAKAAKLVPLRQLTEQRWAGQAVAIYTDSKIGAQFIEKRMRRAGVDARAWTGDLNRRQRDEMKRAFIAGEFPYIIATVQSFGTGIDGFQRATNKVAWISQPQGDPALEDQAIRRIFRHGGTQVGGGFEHVVIAMKDSTDEHTLENLLAKAWQVRTAMNGGLRAAA